MPKHKPECPNEQAIIRHADRYAQKDTALNMQINSQLLEDVKQAAELEGVEDYQSWVTMVLQCAVAEVFTQKES